MRIRGHFSRPKGVREQNHLENCSLVYSFFCKPVGMSVGEEPRYGEHPGLLGSGLATCLTELQFMQHNAQYTSINYLYTLMFL